MKCVNGEGLADFMSKSFDVIGGQNKVFPLRHQVNRTRILVGKLTVDARPITKDSFAI